MRQIENEAGSLEHTTNGSVGANAEVNAVYRFVFPISSKTVKHLTFPFTDFFCWAKGRNYYSPTRILRSQEPDFEVKDFV